jgi:hypothetical protein
VVHAVQFHAVSLLTDRLDEAHHGEGGVTDFCSCLHVRCKLGKLSRYASQNCLLVFIVTNGCSSCLDFILLGPETGQETSDIASPWAAHVQELLLQVVLGMLAPGRELKLHCVPSCFHGLEVLDLHGHFVREPLGQELIHNFVLLVPAPHRLLLITHGFGCVCGDWASVRAIKMAPVSCGVHGLNEAHAEDSPIVPFRVEEGNLAIQVVIGRGGHGSR